jgi:hypothetical protein
MVSTSRIHLNFHGQKKAAVAGGLKVDNREASNRVDRSHSMSKVDAISNGRESLIKSKRFKSSRKNLPCGGAAPAQFAAGRGVDRSGLEELACRVARGAFARQLHLDPANLGLQQRDTLGELLHRQQAEILADVMSDFLPRSVVVVGCHWLLLGFHGVEKCSTAK